MLTFTIFKHVYVLFLRSCLFFDVSINLNKYAKPLTDSFFQFCISLISLVCHHFFMILKFSLKCVKKNIGAAPPFGKVRPIRMNFLLLRSLRCDIIQAYGYIFKALLDFCALLDILAGASSSLY